MSSDRYGLLYIIVLVRGKLSVWRSSQRWQEASAGRYEKWEVMVEHICPFQGWRFVFEERQERGSRGCHPPNISASSQGCFFCLAEQPEECGSWKGLWRNIIHLTIPLLEAQPVFRVGETGRSCSMNFLLFLGGLLALWLHQQHVERPLAPRVPGSTMPTHGGNHPSPRFPFPPDQGSKEEEEEKLKAFYAGGVSKTGGHVLSDSPLGGFSQGMGHKKEASAAKYVMVS